VKCLAVQLMHDQPELVEAAASGKRRIGGFLDIPQEVRTLQVDWSIYEAELTKATPLVGLLEGLQARTPRDTSVLELSAQSGDPHAAARVVTAATLAYLITKWRLARAVADDSLPAVQRELASARERLDKAALDLVAFQESNLPQETGVGSLEEAKNAYLELADLRKQRWTAEANRAAQAAQVTDLRGQARSQDRELVISSQIAANPVVSQLQAQLAAAYGQRLTVLAGYAPGTPEVEAANRRIKDLEKQIEAEVQTVTTSQTKSLNPAYQQAMTQLATAQAAELAARAQVGVLDAAIGRARAKMARLPRDALTLTELTVELEAAQKLYLTIRENAEQLRISAETQVNSPRVITPAMVRPHLAPIRPQKRTALASGFIGGLVLGVLLAFLIEHRNGRNGDKRRGEKKDEK
jgi:uncharacterized protein involved in exopolysaccharide biosynthesis